MCRVCYCISTLSTDDGDCLAGFPGLPGFNGATGFTGATGNPGFPGPGGFRGATGATGFPGPFGSPGRKGDPGNPGFPGSTGKLFLTFSIYISTNHLLCEPCCDSGEIFRYLNYSLLLVIYGIWD